MTVFPTNEQVQMPHIDVCQSLMQPMKMFLPQLNSYRATNTTVCKSVMQRMTICFQQFNSFISHTQLYAILSFGPWQSVCHNWTATDATHSCIPVTHAAHDSLFSTNKQVKMTHTRLYASLSFSPWQSVCHNRTASDSSHSCMPVSHSANDSHFATSEQVKMPHTHGCMPVAHTTNDSLLSTAEQLRMPHTGCMPVSHAAHDSLFSKMNSYRCHTSVSQSLIQPMTVCLPQLNCYRCHTQLYASLSFSLSQSVIHNWTVTDATHSCIPVCYAAHDILFPTTEKLQMSHSQLYRSLSCSTW